MTYNNTSSWADTDTLVRDCKPRSRWAEGMSSLGGLSTGLYPTLLDGQKDTKNAEWNNRSSAVQKQYAALLLSPQAPHTSMPSVIPVTHRYASLTRSERKGEAGGTHKDFNSFNKIKTLGLTPGPTVPNNHRVPEARWNEGAKGKSWTTHQKLICGAQAHRAAHHIIRQKCKSFMPRSI